MAHDRSLSQLAYVDLQGDVIIEVDGNRKLNSEGELLAYLFQKKQPGQTVNLTVLRGGKPQQIQLAIP